MVEAVLLVEHQVVGTGGQIEVNQVCACGQSVGCQLHGGSIDDPGFIGDGTLGLTDALDAQDSVAVSISVDADDQGGGAGGTVLADHAAVDGHGEGIVHNVSNIQILNEVGCAVVADGALAFCHGELIGTGNSGSEQEVVTLAASQSNLGATCGNNVGSVALIMDDQLTGLRCGSVGQDDGHLGLVCGQSHVGLIVVEAAGLIGEHQFNLILTLCHDLGSGAVAVDNLHGGLLAVLQEADDDTFGVGVAEGIGNRHLIICFTGAGLDFAAALLAACTQHAAQAQDHSQNQSTGSSLVIHEM